jgi:signal peptide peptidase SppA
MIDIHQITAEPLLVAPHASMAFASSLAGARKPEEFDHSLDVAAVYGASVAPREEKTFAFDPGSGVAFIPVRGTLLNRFGGAYSWATGYQAITQMAAAAAADPQVRAGVLDVDSFGGEAAGCFECAAGLRAAFRAAGKPLIAVVNSNAYSAGYALAAAADRIVLIPSGGAGSIGVVTMHVDYSKSLSSDGIKVTYIHGGAHKVDGNPYQPLPDDVRADIQTRIDERYSAVVAHVAAMRGLSDQAVRDTEARMFGAKDALTLGLIDETNTAPEAYTAFVASLPATTGSFQLEATVPDIDQAAVAGAERARIKAIITGAEAAGRTALANKLAFDTNMDAETAVALLAAAPVASAAPAAAAADPLAVAMAAAGTPGIVPDGTDSAAADETSATVARLLAFQRKK